MATSLAAIGIGRSRLPMIMQTEAAECGLACLAMVAAFHGHQADLGTLRRRHAVSLRGMTLKGVLRLAGQLKLACRPLRLEPGHLAQLRLPAILHWDLDHFVVLKTVSERRIVVHDPAIGERSLTLAEASPHLTGVALELTPMGEFAAKREVARLPLLSFWRATPGLVPALSQIFVLSALLEIFVIASPIYMQLAIDEVVVKGDADLLLVLALGFGLLTVVSVTATALRSFIILILQNSLSLQLTADLFRHLLRLPLGYFEKRHVGDVLSRFGSTEPVRKQLAEGLIAALIDGLMALATLVMIIAYSGALATVVVAAVLLYAGLRVALYRTFRQRSEAVIRAKARESTIQIETMQAVQSVKLFNREAEREGTWLNRYAEVINATVRLGRVNIAFKTLNDAIFGLENILTVYLGVRLALDGSLSVGMLFAFASYKRHFTEKAVALVEKALDLRILDLHLERLGDIALSPVEPGHDRPLTISRPLEGRVELRDVSFRYGEGEPLVLDHVSLTVEPGEFVSITGPSGGGKTTLVKLMLGLLEPTSGEVLIDGTPLARMGARPFREQVAAVMQDDNLLAGSLADNITFFDATPDAEWLLACSRMAGLHDEVLAMPMGYDTLVGDLGSGLSGGQKQRLLLARALYRRPRILFLDEGTAHLDLDAERRIGQALKSLAITRISVAHRPETVAAADRVVTIGQQSIADARSRLS